MSRYRLGELIAAQMAELQGTDTKRPSLSVCVTQSCFDHSTWQRIAARLHNSSIAVLLCWHVQAVQYMSQR